MRKLAYVTCALVGLMAAPVVVSTAHADDIRQDRQDIRRDERALQRDEARERHELREGDARGAARVERKEQRDEMQLQRDRQELARDRAERRY